MTKPAPECSRDTIDKLSQKMQKIEDTLYGSKKKEDLVSRIVSKIDVESLKGKLDTIIVIGFILITLSVIGITLICFVQDKVADIYELTRLL